MAYARQVLNVEPWAGVNGKKGQLELFEDIGASVRAQLAGEPAVKVFHVEAGHGVGKTFGAAALVNWFFDAFAPSITMTTAPTSDQVEKLLWKNIRTQRDGKGLPGKLMPAAPQMSKAANHFAYGRTTNNSGGQGTSRVQGQHDEYLLFILDEAEGLDDYVFDAVDAMMTGGRVLICLMIANPLTRTSPFHKRGKEANVARYRLSALDFPNVVLGREVIKGGTSRGWVDSRIIKHCEAVNVHNEDEHTFTVPWDVINEEDGTVAHPAGTVLMPDAVFMFRVMGLPPKNLSAKTLVTPGRYEAAVKRAAPNTSPDAARYGVDVARDGDDVGTIYRHWKGTLTRIARLAKLRTGDYLGALKDDMGLVSAAGAMSIHVRVDAGGGWGSGVIDGLNDAVDLQGLVPDFQVFEVHNNGVAYDEAAYADLVTEMYAEAGETLKGINVHRPPAELEQDLTEREYRWVNVRGKSVKKLEPKDVFKKRILRSPDDGDGAVLALGPDHLFRRMEVVTRAIEHTFDLDTIDADDF